MEKNAQVKLVGLFLGVVLAVSCSSTKWSNTEVSDIETTAKMNKTYQNMSLINEMLGRLDGYGCGTTNKAQKWLGQMLVSNGDIFDCLRKGKDSHEALKSVLLDMMCIVDFTGSTSYLNFLHEIRGYDDKEFFQKALELLKVDSKPNYTGGDVIYGPVYEAVNENLIMPHIKHIDGKPLIEYFEEDRNRQILYHVELFGHMSYYRQMKDLWESGRITLTSEE